MYAEIIAVGNELLSGATANTNSMFLARNLGLMGFDVHHQSVVGDNEADIVEAVKIAGARSHVVVLTGGLGPTKDDMTKEAVAKAFNLTLVESPAVLLQIKEFFEQQGRQITTNNFKQAMVIQGGDILNNVNGTAPGILLQTTTQAIAMLPGPPNEMEFMFEHELKQRLEKLSGDFSAGTSLHVFGIGEAALEEQVRDLLYARSPQAALYAKPGEVYIDIIARSRISQQDADEQMQKQIEDFKQRIGECIYSENGQSMAETVVGLLMRKKEKIAIAESATGGVMAAHLTDVPGASKVFEYGAVTYADWIKSDVLGVEKTFLRRFTGASSAVAGEMAQHVREKARADIGVAITGIAGPSVGDYLDKTVGIFYIAIADRSKVIVKKFNFGDRRSRVLLREQSAMHAFDMVRRLLMKLDIDDARRFAPDHVAEVEREAAPRKKSAIKAQKTVAALLLAVFAAAGAFGVWRTIRTSINAGVYETLGDQYRSLQGSDTTAIVGLDTLTQRNGDTVGWLSAGEGGLDTVVVSGRDNGYYENHDFDQKPNQLGCVYLDEHSSLGTNTRNGNTILYGSSENNALLLGPLRSYTSAQYLAEHPMIQFNTLYGSDDYKVTAVFYANTNGENGEVQTGHLISDFANEESFEKFVVEMKMRSILSVDVSIVTGDTFLTLVTETSDWDGARLVVVARRLREGETRDVLASAISGNSGALYPQAWYDLAGKESTVNEEIERDRWLNWLIDNEKSYEQEGTPQTGNGVATTDDPYFAATSEGDVVIEVLMNGEVLTDSLLNIVSRMVAYEIGVEQSEEATKAQAIACVTQLRREYVSGFVPSLHGYAPDERLVNLVAEVIHIGMFYNGEIAYTPYFGVSSGYTYSAAQIYDTDDYPYLVSVESRYDYLNRGYTRTFNFNEDVVRSRIESFYNITLSDNSQNWLRIMSYADGGAVRSLSIDGKIMVSGADFALNCMAIRSPHFTITLTYEGFSFYCKGYGDGVGMSKAGAELYATQSRWTYEEILTHYYPGVQLQTITW